MNDRLGPITFDRIRVAFAGDTTDIPLGPQEADMADQPTDTTPLHAPWVDEQVKLRAIG